MPSPSKRPTDDPELRSGSLQNKRNHGNQGYKQNRKRKRKNLKTPKRNKRKLNQVVKRDTLSKKKKRKSATKRGRKLRSKKLTRGKGSKTEGSKKQQEGTESKRGRQVWPWMVSSVFMRRKYTIPAGEHCLQLQHRLSRIQRFS